MNNDLEQFSEERLKDMQKHVAAGMALGYADALLIHRVIDIVLSAKQAKPVNSPCEKCNGSGFMDSGGTQPWGEPISVECDCTTPQPAHTEQVNSPEIPDGWKLVPIEPTEDMLKAGCRFASEHNTKGSWSQMLASAPKPESE